ncbi:YesL family protein [Halobacillus seohaensis]|uniref:YesL family protein n=1 Tax=Halobacillus seohaensis TaxID=447421 RepID=A0ABW2EJM6_9BACI
MQNYNGIFGFIYLLASWFMRLSVTNFLWFVLNIPVTIVVWTYLINDEGTHIYALPLVVLLPLLFYPASAALFAMARDWMRDEEHDSLLKMYVAYLRSNYRTSFVSGLIWTLLWSIWILDFRFFAENNDLLATVFSILGILLVVMNIHFLSMIVHYEMTIRERFFNSFYMTVGRPGVTVITALIVSFIIYIASTLWFVIIFFAGSLIATISFYLFYRSYLKIRQEACNI